MTQAPHHLSRVIISLMKGVIYEEEDRPLWQAMLGQQAHVRDHVGVLGLDLVLDEAEGYAFLRQRQTDEADEEQPLPRLVARRPLGFPVSLLLVLLREKLMELDTKGGDTRLILDRDQVVEMMQLFLPDSSNQAKITDKIDSHIDKVVDLGFLRRLPGQSGLFEVRRILKAFVDAQWLGEFDRRLGEYRTRLAGGEVE
ncbi:DUF4194 domain-containing protein [Magnetospirillum sp. UT-4]|uniref:DUF4194 domain-containing protein n=1 Tax=Magnetospirillum sp. UT-4 TaxID=2681467 RepID=UPI00138203CE|nr:DUF4194 domain-containing protein [Magnetospirillum sp. UT-4]CAA7612924.1 conserved hypothetical protein [Magnetospirillum sp. UT-4]